MQTQDIGNKYILMLNVVNLDDMKCYLKNFNEGTNYSVEEMDGIYNKLLNAAV